MRPLLRGVNQHGRHRRCWMLAAYPGAAAQAVRGWAVRVACRSHIRRVHLITPDSAAKRPAAALPLPPPARRCLSTRPRRMASLESVTQSLAALALAPAAAVKHDAASAPAAWRAALEASSAPHGFELVKTIVYKPKTAKTATPVPVVAIARENTDIITGALGRKLNVKELRLASEDLLSETFQIDKHARTSVHACVLRLIVTTICSVPPRAHREQFFKGRRRAR